MTKAETRFIHTTGRDGIHKVIALGQYHGETVRATAKCAPNDTPSVDDGETLAGLRLEKKILKRRKAFAEAQLTKKYDYLEFLAAEMDKTRAAIARTEANIDEIAAAQAANETDLAGLLARL